MSEVRIGIEVDRTDGRHVYRMAFQTSMKGPQPTYGTWFPTDLGEWERPASDINIQAEIDRAFREWQRLKEPDRVISVVAWWRMTDAEWEVMTADRPYRNACVYTASAISHDMVRARECYRTAVRRARTPIFVKLDGEWMRATGQGRTAEAAQIEALRQQWRDATTNPEIEIALTIDDLKAVAYPADSISRA